MHQCWSKQQKKKNPMSPWTSSGEKGNKNTDLKINISGGKKQNRAAAANIFILGNRQREFPCGSGQSQGVDRSRWSRGMWRNLWEEGLMEQGHRTLCLLWFPPREEDNHFQHPQLSAAGGAVKTGHCPTAVGGGQSAAQNVHHSHFIKQWWAHGSEPPDVSWSWPPPLTTTSSFFFFCGIYNCWCCIFNTNKRFKKKKSKGKNEGRGQHCCKWIRNSMTFDLMC